VGVDETRYPCRFLQSNRDRREIYAVVERDGTGYGYGPLPLEQIDARLFGGPGRPSRLGPGDPALAASLAARAGECHDLEDFYRFYGYPPDVIDWVESTDLRGPDVMSLGWFRAGGRDIAEVSRRLGVDSVALYEGSDGEVADPGNYDPEGNPLFYPEFWENWAVGDLSGRRSVNPRSYRFKAWLSFHT
jgi:hypothetical protein